VFGKSGRLCCYDRLILSGPLAVVYHGVESKLGCVPSWLLVGRSTLLRLKFWAWAPPQIKFPRPQRIWFSIWIARIRVPQLLHYEMRDVSSCRWRYWAWSARVGANTKLFCPFVRIALERLREVQVFLWSNLPNFITNEWFETKKKTIISKAWALISFTSNETDFIYLMNQSVNKLMRAFCNSLEFVGNWKGWGGTFNCPSGDQWNILTNDRHPHPPESYLKRTMQ